MEDTIILQEPEQVFKPYAELTRANHVLINNIKLKRDGWRYNCLSAILISTFRFEGLVNQFGAKRISFWKEVETLSWRRRFEVMCSEFQILLDFEDRPYRTIADLFSFRDDLVHNNSGTANKSALCSYLCMESSQRRWPQSKWESLCNLDFVLKCNEDIETIAKSLCDRAGMDWDKFRSTGCLS